MKINGYFLLGVGIGIALFFLNYWWWFHQYPDMIGCKP